MQIHYSVSVIVNATATRYTHSLNKVLTPLTSTVRSLFTHVHSTPLSLAARLHWCHTNPCHYINSGWTFSGQTSYRRGVFKTGGSVSWKYVWHVPETQGNKVIMVEDVGGGGFQIMRTLRAITVCFGGFRAAEWLACFCWTGFLWLHTENRQQWDRSGSKVANWDIIIIQVRDKGGLLQE